MNSANPPRAFAHAEQGFDKSIVIVTFGEAHLLFAPILAVCEPPARVPRYSPIAGPGWTRTGIPIQGSKSRLLAARHGFATPQLARFAHAPLPPPRVPALFRPVFCDAESHYAVQRALKVDESKRPGGPSQMHTEAQFGCEGSFRKLALD